MIAAVMEIDKGNHSELYELSKDGEIQYSEHHGKSSKTNYGYLTNFSYYKEFEEGNIKED